MMYIVVEKPLRNPKPSPSPKEAQPPSGTASSGRSRGRHQAAFQKPKEVL